MNFAARSGGDEIPDGTENLEEIEAEEATTLVKPDPTEETKSIEKVEESEVGSNNGQQDSFNRTVQAQIITEDTSLLSMNLDKPYQATDHVVPEKLSTSVLYENVYQGVDFLYNLCGYNIKESIIVKEPQQKYCFSFKLDIEGLEPKMQDDGSVILENKDGQAIYFIPAPYLFDNANQTSNDASYSLVNSEDGYILTVEASPEWMNASDRSYPVTINPTLFLCAGNAAGDIYATYVEEGHPDRVHGSNQDLYFGYTTYDGAKERQIYMHINKLPTLPAGSVVANSKVSLWQFDYSHVGCSQMKIGLYEVSDNKPDKYSSYHDWIYYMTWNNKPAYDYQNMIDYTISSKSVDDGYLNWDITELTNKWYKSGTANRTVALVVIDDNPYSYNHCAVPAFYAYGRRHPPILTVSYRNNIGIEPYYTYRALSVGQAGNAFIADSSGQLKVTKTIASYSSSINPFVLNLVYNSDYFTESSTAADTIKSDHSVDMCFGNGFTLDIVQTIKEFTREDSANTYLIYRDGDGTAHYLEKQDDGTYKDEDGIDLSVVKKGEKYTMTTKGGRTLTFDNGILSRSEDEYGNAISTQYRTGSNGRWFYDIYQENKNQTPIKVASITYLNGTENVKDLTDAAGNVYTFTYNSDNCLELISKNSTPIVKYNYSGNRIIGMMDLETNYQLWLHYSGGKISSYQEWTYGSDGGAQAGALVYCDYSDGQATYRDCGADRKQSDDDVITKYSFDYGGRTINAYSTDYTGDILAASNAEYTKTEKNKNTQKNNRVVCASSIGFAAQNLLENSSFENGVEGWDVSNTNGAGSVYKSQFMAHSGISALAGHISAEDERLLSAQTHTLLTSGETYTFSGYIDTRWIDRFGSRKGIYLQSVSPSGSVWNSDEIHFKTGTTEDEWIRLSVTFTAPESGNYSLRLCADGISGYVYADDFQLEVGEAPSRRNMVENGNLQRWAEGWDMQDNATYGWTGNDYYISILGNPDKPSQAWQYVPVNLPSTETYVLSGWAKGNAVPDNYDNVSEENHASDNNKTFGLQAIITYTDGGTEYFYAPFSPDIVDWQYVSIAVVPKKQNAIVKDICVVCTYERNANSAIFDNISLVCEVAQTMKYDKDGNLVKVGTTNREDEEMSYYPNSNLLKTYTGDGTSYTYTYDSTYKHQLKSASDGVITQSMGYDSLGNVTSNCLSGGGLSITSTAAYTNNGNLLSSYTDASGSTVSYDYGDASSVMYGTPTSTVDPKGVATTTKYDTYGRVLENQIAGTAEVGYTYSNGNLIETIRTDHKGAAQRYQMAYDLWGNRTALQIGNKAISTQEYANGNGLLSNESYTNGLSISYQYDVLDRLKSKAYSDGRKLDYTYTGDGQLYSIYDSRLDRNHIYDYDNLGRIINYRQDDIWGKYAYDDCNRLIGLKFSAPSTGPKEIQYYYNFDTSDGVSDGLLSSMTMVGGDTISYQYDELQRPYQKHINSGKSGGGIWEQYLYEDGKSTGTSGRVSGKKNWIDNRTVSHDFHYTYDQVGNILTETDSHNGTTVSYTYDNQNQLTGAAYHNGRVEAYSYDTVGNLLTFDNGVQSHTYTYGDSDWKDLLTEVDGKPLTYDSIGNPVHYENGSYAYDFSWSEGRRLSSVVWSAGGQTTTYEYDHNGVRTKKITQSGAVVYDLVNSQAVGETRYNADGSVSVYIRYLFDGAGTIVGIGLWNPADTAWTDYYFVKNLQGDVLQVYRESDNALAASYSYDSWGNVLTASGPLAKINPFRYRGYYYDTETWFYYLQSRYYDPSIGRFINADSYISTGTGTLGNNMFAYCNNSPISHKDTTGDVVDVVFDVASLCFSIVDVTANPYDPTAWFGLIGDVVDVVVPFVSGVGETAKAIGAIHKAVDIADDIHDTGKSVKRGWKVGDNISNLTEAGTVPTWNTVRRRYWKNAEHYKVDSPLYPIGDVTYKGQKVNNAKRIKQGYAPIGYDGYPVNLHHTVGKSNDLFNVVQMSRTAHQVFHKRYGYKGFSDIRAVCQN